MGTCVFACVSQPIEGTSNNEQPSFSGAQTSYMLICSLIPSFTPPLILKPKYFHTASTKAISTNFRPSQPHTPTRSNSAQRGVHPPFNTELTTTTTTTSTTMTSTSSCAAAPPRSSPPPEAAAPKAPRAAARRRGGGAAGPSGGRSGRCAWPPAA